MHKALYLAEILIWGNVPYTAGLEKMHFLVFEEKPIAVLDWQHPQRPLC